MLNRGVPVFLNILRYIFIYEKWISSYNIKPMNRFLRQLLFLLSISVLLLTVSCRDDSLREDLEIKESQEGKDDNDNNNSDYIRVVSDPEAALATANCIMIKPGETTSIPVAKAFAVWEQNQTLFGKKFSPNGDLGTILIWAIPNDLIDSEYLEITGYEDINRAAINVKSKPGSKGNAVIALTVDGEVRWSWHLWVTDYNPDKDLQSNNLKTGPNIVDGGKLYRYKNNTGDNIFMDRNLGANSADKTKGKETHGMYYQWGKKDPMPGFAPPNYFPETLFDLPAEYRENNLAYSIEFPDEYINQRGRSGGEWYSYNEGIHNHDLWGSISNKKSIYDPCPEGWRIPAMSEEQEEAPGWRVEYSPWYVIEPENQFVRTNPQNSLDCESPALGFFPETGCIVDGELWKHERSASLWTATAFHLSWDERSYMSRIMGEYPVVILDNRGKGFNVRCIRRLEEKTDIK